MAAPAPGRGVRAPARVAEACPSKALGPCRRAAVEGCAQPLSVPGLRLVLLNTGQGTGEGGGGRIWG